MMSATGVCPHCGKTFKRLNSHLPHCKAKALPEPSQSQSSKDTLSTPPSSGPPASSSAKTRKSVTPSKESPMKTGLKIKKDKESRLSELPSTPLKSGSESPSPPSRPTSSKRNPPRLADQTQMVSPVSSIPPSAPSPSPPEPANDAPSGGTQTTSHHMTGPISADPTSAALPPAPHPLRSAAVCPTRKQGAGKKRPSSLAPETQREDPFKAEISSPSPLTSQTSGPPADRIPLGGVLVTAETPSRSLDARGVQNVSGAHARATLQNVRDTLGRSKVSAQQVELGSLDLIQTSLLTRGVAGVQTPLKHADGIGLSFTSTSPSTQWAGPAPLVTELWAASPPEKEGFTPATAVYPSPPPPAPPQGLAPPPCLASAAALVGLTRRNRCELDPRPASSSLTQSSSSSSFLPCPLTPSGEQDPLRGRITMKDPEVNMRNLKLINAIEGNLAGRRLGQVRLGELPMWLALHAPSRPRGALEAVRQGWRWYQRRYIDVKRGGLGGLGMLLAGYCVLGYAWSYPQRKSDRWRKYH